MINTFAFSSRLDTTQVSAAFVLKGIVRSYEKYLASQFKPVLEFAENIPAYSANMLEVHFDREDAWFDFAFRANVQFDHPLIYSEAQLNRAPAFVRNAYQKLFDANTGNFRYGIENLCFEYDFPYQSAPSVFFDIYRDSNISFREKYAALSAIGNILNYTLSDKLPDFLRRIYDNNLTVVYFGLLPSRKQAPVRITLNGLHSESLAETLSELGWDGSYKALSEVQKNYLDSAHKIVLAVDFSGRLSPRIGIEIFNNDSSALFDKLYKNSAFSEAHYRVLTSWQGKVALDADTSAVLTQLHQRPISCLYKRVNHFKCIIEGEAVKMKAYLYYCF